MDNGGDNRFEIIGKAKQDLLKSTNIDSSKDEMKVLDNFLFRCWQMGWLNQYNLTSDAEGEELLTCEKSKAMQLYSHLLDLVENERISEHYSEWCDLEREYIALFGENVFAALFGSKCLPDAREVNFVTKKSQPAEPKFKIGDELVWDKRILVKIDEVFADGKYLVFSRNGNRYMVKESDLEPYSEPVGTKDDTKGNTKDPTFTDDCKSQCKSPDRLRIAAMAMEGILSKGELTAPDEVTDKALIYADELIKKCEAGSTL